MTIEEIRKGRPKGAVAYKIEKECPFSDGKIWYVNNLGMYWQDDLWQNFCESDEHELSQYELKPL